jgi:hypothetical protein
MVARHETGRTTTPPQRTNNTMNAITAGLLHNLRLEDQILTYNKHLAQIKELGMALRETFQDTPQHQAIYELLEGVDNETRSGLQHEAQDCCTQIVADLIDSGINATSACGDKGDYTIELVTPAGTHLIAGCQL